MICRSDNFLLNLRDGRCRLQHLFTMSDKRHLVRGSRANGPSKDSGGQVGRNATSRRIPSANACCQQSGQLGYPRTRLARRHPCPLIQLCMQGTARQIGHNRPLIAQCLHQNRSAGLIELGNLLQLRCH